MANSSEISPPLDPSALRLLEAKIEVLLPPQYRDCYDSVSPVSMGSATLTYQPDGSVDWDGIWTHFCDLALAGGPPHRGTLLEPCSVAEVRAHEEKYQQVVAEMGRGIWLVTSLPVLLRAAPGWVGVRCPNNVMAGWLQRAIVAENVLARRDGCMLLLPAGPHFRIDKEIKNVVASLAKTCHYWIGHMTPGQQESIAAFIGNGEVDSELLEPAPANDIEAAPEPYQAVLREMEQGVARILGLAVIPSPCPGWIGVRCADERMAVWLMRALIVDNVLARREGDILCVPVSLKPLSPGRNNGVIGRAFELWKLHLAQTEP